MKNKLLVLGALLSPLFLACGGSNFSLPGADATFQDTPVTNNKVDILFLSDDSSSMLSYRQQMGAQAQNMIAALNQLGMDYHIAVTATSVGAGYLGGTFIGNTYLTNSSPNVASTLGSMLAFTNVGSDLEQGLYSVQLALSPANLNVNGNGFLRSDALLAIVVVSDDNDYSSGTVASYSQFLNTIKPPFPSGVSSWVLNYVGSLSLSSTCSQFVNVGSRYIQMAQTNNGIEQSICNTNWSVAMGDVQVLINQILTNYYLNTQPNPSSIVVTVNGVVVPQSSTNGWTLQTSTATNGSTQYYIQFNGSAIPSFYNTVSVNFTPASAS
jgi:hypothetical protein